MDMQRALRQEVSSICHAVEASECARCMRHRRIKEAKAAHRVAGEVALRTGANCILFISSITYHRHLQCPTGPPSSLRRMESVSCAATSTVGSRLFQATFYSMQSMQRTRCSTPAATCACAISARISYAPSTIHAPCAARPSRTSYACS